MSMAWAAAIQSTIRTINKASEVELFNHYAFEYGVAGLAGGMIVASDYLVGIANAIGTADNDRLYGDNGNNVLRPGAGADWLYGMGGSDTVDYSDVVAGVYVDLGASFAVKALTDGASFLNQATVGPTTTDSVSGFTHATGSAFDDRLYGTGGSNTLSGGGGADFIYGLGGADFVLGGAGDDRIVGGDGIDTLTGGLGGDRFYFTGVETGGADLITDFSAAEGDRIYASQSSYGAAITLYSGTGGADAIFAGRAGGFGFDTVTSALYFDADGAGGTAAKQLSRPCRVCIRWRQLASSAIEPRPPLASAMLPARAVGRQVMARHGKDRLPGCGRLERLLAFFADAA